MRDHSLRTKITVLAVLIGGLGLDHLLGQSSDDVLIGGTTAHDNDTTALHNILTQWSSSLGFNARIAALSDELNIDSVFSDAVRDELFGSSGRNWFLDFALEDAFPDFSSDPTRGDRRN